MQVFVALICCLIVTTQAFRTTSEAPIYIPRGCPASPGLFSTFCASVHSECEVGRDSDCPNGLICCPGACGNFCQKELDFTLPQLPTTPVPRSCPSMNPFAWCGFMPRENCHVGSNTGCSDGHICCPGSCGNTCIKEIDFPDYSRFRK